MTKARNRIAETLQAWRAEHVCTDNELATAHLVDLLVEEVRAALADEVLENARTASMMIINERPTRIAGFLRRRAKELAA